MALILTFLGKGGTGKTTLAIATAKHMASTGKRVLLALSEPPSVIGLMLGQVEEGTPGVIESNLEAVNLRSAALLERSWEDVKQLEAQYLQKPFFKEVFGQELGLLPGMDGALALYALRDYDQSGNYDVIVYDGDGDRETLRMLGTPEIMSWYIRRFRDVIVNSDVGQALSPFLGPISSAVLNVDLSKDNFAAPTQEANSTLDAGKAAITNPNRVAAYLVTTGDKTALAKAMDLWGSAQQVGVTVGGVILNKSVIHDTQAAEAANSFQELYDTFDHEAIDVSTATAQFEPLSISIVPFEKSRNWQVLQKALPDFTEATRAPKPITLDVAQKSVSLFLPGFDKKQVKLTQYGPEITIEAGDQRRNILLPPALSGKPVKGAKFQDRYLNISF
ncbi:ArsA family ATPase [Roseofilum reptotaenium CS-1145]|uniref:Arsenic-transporting ATPase n=1 Tax=Roseofilum reptotaenium AO1-A TaxID=1925591 RepID=A0A1L9QSU9_9CYAN|nr:ArsA family ATPase [Roseofilum reptotaenium]MDB9519473.1 ArsA family ATPase [Roseofilum reptotaenium CS-1145]OJJ25744.1 arsenic-transporting ATPase [Roseofilum reptotaenium AO1-A]